MKGSVGLAVLGADLLVTVDTVFLVLIVVAGQAKAKWAGCVKGVAPDDVLELVWETAKWVECSECRHDEDSKIVGMVCDVELG